jgi:hypothetical protein
LAPPKSAMRRVTALSRLKLADVQILPPLGKWNGRKAHPALTASSMVWTVSTDVFGFERRRKC